MSSYTVSVRHAAERDIAQAQVWYEKQQAGLAAQFLAEFILTMDVLAETPLLYPVLYRDVRRVVLHRFPYLVWYRVEGLDVTVLACTHGKSNPEKVRRRLR